MAITFKIKLLKWLLLSVSFSVQKLFPSALPKVFIYFLIKSTKSTDGSFQPTIG